MSKYIVLTGMAYIVEATNADEAIEKLYAEDAGEDCPCGLPQWAEQADAEGAELCTCVEEFEVLTQVVDTYVE